MRALILVSRMTAAVDKLDMPQDTLDLMILTILSRLSRETMHGCGIPPRRAALSYP